MKHFLCLLLVFWASIGRAQIREVPAPSLNDIAMASMDQYGPVIYYNPLVCMQVGVLVTAFFKAHEYGHHYLGHVMMASSRNPYVQNWLQATQETAADNYAIQYWVGQDNKTVLQAAAQFFWNNPNAGDRTHPPSRVRAQNIVNGYFQLTNTPLFQ